MKTVSVALVLCLNVGVDPPDVVKTQPCARLECWIGSRFQFIVQTSVLARIFRSQHDSKRHEGPGADRKQSAGAVRALATQGEVQAVSRPDNGGRQEVMHFAQAQRQGGTRTVSLQRPRSAQTHN